MIKFITLYISVFAISGLLYGCGDTVQSASGNGQINNAGEDVEVSTSSTTNEAAIPVESSEEENVIGCSDESKLDPESDCFVE